MITAVIPTRNRPRDLVKAVASILAQTRPPEELLIVDQSPDSQSRDAVQALLVGNVAITLTYVLDSGISGLVEAKQVAANMALGDIVCFLEDDVVLESEFLEEILRGFQRYPDMMGCCGVITNPPTQPGYYPVLFHFFHRGIYRDKRVGIYGGNQGYGNSLIESDCISGGLSAWRREVFAEVAFDCANGFHMYEDIDFSTRVSRRYGGHLYINPNARLAHYCSPVNRLTLGARQRRKMSECVIFFRKRRHWPWAYLSMSWLVTGCFLEAGLQSLKVCSVQPIAGFFQGMWDGLSKPLQSS
jgi:GT2 family glycosyltransferase